MRESFTRKASGRNSQKLLGFYHPTGGGPGLMEAVNWCLQDVMPFGWLQTYSCLLEQSAKPYPSGQMGICGALFFFAEGIAGEIPVCLCCYARALFWVRSMNTF